MKFLFLPGSHNAPSDRFRIHQFVQPLEKLGHTVHVKIPAIANYWRCRLQKTNYPQKLIFWGSTYLARGTRICQQSLNAWLSKQYDVAFLNRHLVSDQNIFLPEKILFARSKRIVYDIDDAIFNVGYIKKAIFLISNASHVIAGNKFIENFARQYNKNVTVIPTVIDTKEYKIKKFTYQSGRFKIGWIGSSDTLINCLPAIRNVFQKLNKILDYEFIYICDKPLDSSWHGTIKNATFIRWSPESEVSNLHKFDIGIMPLIDNEFQRGKCGAKLLQYMGIGIPSISSPVGVNTEICTHGETGFLAKTDDEWTDSILFLHKNFEACKKMGLNARERVERFYSLDYAVPKLVDVFKKSTG